MPTFTEKARRLERFRLTLRKHYGEPAPRPEAPNAVEHVLRMVLAEEATPEQVDQAMERLREHFVDWNDLRVSQPREVRETLSSGFPRAGYKARVLTRLLDQVFKQHNSMVWDFLEDMGKLETRAFFERLEEVRPFVAATLARDLAGAHTFPVDRDVARVLGRLGILDPEAQSETEMQAFLERAVKSPRAPGLHALIKRLAADLCVVDNPLCPKCPLRKSCPTGQARGKRSKAAKGKKKAAKKGGAKKVKKAKKSAKKRTKAKSPKKKSGARKTTRKKSASKTKRAAAKRKTARRSAKKKKGRSGKR